MSDYGIASWIEFSDSAPAAPTDGPPAQVRRTASREGQRQGLVATAHGQATEKSSTHTDTPETDSSTPSLSPKVSSTAPPEPADEMSQIPTMPLARAAGLAFTLMGAAFLNTLAVQAMVIAMPSIGEQLNMPPSRYQWIITSYSLTFGCFLLLWGKVGDIYGKRLVFLLGGLWVSVTTLATAFSPTEIVFDVLRALSGLGAAANVPAAIGLLGTSIPPGKIKSYCFAIYAAGAPLGSISGTLIGGVLTQFASWEWIFYFVAIVSILITLTAYFVIPLPTVSGTDKTITLDYIGAFLITTSMILLIFALSQGNSSGRWETPYIPSLILVSVILFILFVVWEWWLEHKTEREPLMRLSVWSHGGFTVSMIITGFFWASFNNYLVYATFFYQDFLHLSPIATALRFLPTGVGGALMTVVSGYLLSRVSGQRMLIVGVICASVSFVLMAVPIPPETSYWAYGFPAMILAVVGADTVYPCLSLYTTSIMPMKDQALAGGIFTAVGQVGRAVGLVLATSVDTSVRKRGGNALGDVLPTVDIGQQRGREDWILLAGLRTAQWLNFAMAVIALVAVVCGLKNIGKIGAEKEDAPPNGVEE